LGEKISQTPVKKPATSKPKTSQPVKLTKRITQAIIPELPSVQAAGAATPPVLAPLPAEEPVAPTQPLGFFWATQIAAPAIRHQEPVATEIPGSTSQPVEAVTPESDAPAEPESGEPAEEQGEEPAESAAEPEEETADETEAGTETEETTTEETAEPGETGDEAEEPEPEPEPEQPRTTCSQFEPRAANYTAHLSSSSNMADINQPTLPILVVQLSINQSQTFQLQLPDNCGYTSNASNNINLFGSNMFLGRIEFVYDPETRLFTGQYRFCQNGWYQQNMFDGDRCRDISNWWYSRRYVTSAYLVNQPVLALKSNLTGEYTDWLWP
jgi:hypothetical protein